jgi:hypothetical protein
MGQKTDNKVMKQMQNLWNQKPNNRQHLSDDEINDMLSSDERVDKLYNMMKGKINEIGDTENGMYAIGQVAGRAYDRMFNSPRNKKVDGVVALDPKYGKVAQDAAYAAAGGYIQWQKNFEKANGRKPSDKERQAYMQNYHNGGLDYGKPESERKGVIKLSESQLRGMIAECMKKVLSEKYSYQKYGKKSNGLDSDSVHSTIKMMTPQCQNPRKGFDSDSVHKVIKGMMGEDTSWYNDPSHDTESRIPSSYIGSSAGDIEQIKHNLENITNHIYSICKGLSNEDYSFGYMDANSKTTDVLRKMWPLVHELGDIWGYCFY